MKLVLLLMVMVMMMFVFVFVVFGYLFQLVMMSTAERCIRVFRKEILQLGHIEISGYSITSAIYFVDVIISIRIFRSEHIPNLRKKKRNQIMNTE